MRRFLWEGCEGFGEVVRMGRSSLGKRSVTADVYVSLSSVPDGRGKVSTHRMVAHRAWVTAAGP